jgi:aldose sugar dehydrogenase
MKDISIPFICHCMLKHGYKISISILLIFVFLFTINQSNSLFAQTAKNKILPQINDSNLQVQVYAPKFSFPTGMDYLGPDDILIIEKNTGKVKEIKNQTVIGTILDLNVANVSERGLLGIAISDKPKYVFLYYTETEGFDGGKVLGNRVYRYEYIDGKLINPKLLIDLPTLPGPSHNGGVLKIGPDKQSLYLTIGNLNYIQDPNFLTKAQNNKTGPPADGRGGILRMTFDGEVVDKKGILGDTHPLNKYYAYGIRNSFGITFDPVSGKLWDTENGGTYDEINLVEPGFNSGWKGVMGKASLQKNFDKDKLEDFDGKGKYSDPEFSWPETNGVNPAPTALVFFNSDKLGSKYKDTLFVGGIKNGTIFNFNLDNKRLNLLLSGPLSDKVADNINETSDVTFGKNFGVITDLKVGTDANLYVLSNYKHDGRLFRIVSNSTVNEN